MIRYQKLHSPIGTLSVAENDAGLVAVLFEEQPPREGWLPVDELDSGAGDQLRAYFEGELRAFDLPLAPRGTEFQRQVWQAVSTIPYGDTRSYLEIAESFGHGAAVRAVGAANGKNPLPIVVPCHRVVGTDGSLTGYAGGFARKRRLLELEQPGRYGPGPLFTN